MERVNIIAENGVLPFSLRHLIFRARTYTHTRARGLACVVRFTDGTGCSIANELGPSARVTRASMTVAHMANPVTEFVFDFGPKLVLPV
jgi:hypothetical protein